MQQNSSHKASGSPRQIPARHHFNPEFYLRGWAGEDGKLSVVQNFGGKIHYGRCSPKATGFEYHLYSYSEDFREENRAEIETSFFSRLDSEGARILSKIINNEYLERKDRILFAQFLSSMKIRNPVSIKQLKVEACETFLKELEAGQADYEARKQDKDPATFREWVALNRPGLIENIGVAEIPKVASFPPILSDILKMSWYTVDFKTASKPLLTSDRPVWRERGLNHPDCIIALPLSPRYGFFACKPQSNAFQRLIRTPISQLAARLNNNIIRQAEKYGYCSSATDAPDSFFQKRLKSSLPAKDSE